MNFSDFSEQSRRVPSSVTKHDIDKDLKDHHRISTLISGVWKNVQNWTTIPIQWFLYILNCIPAKIRTIFLQVRHCNSMLKRICSRDFGLCFLVSFDRLQVAALTEHVRLLFEYHFRVE
jgi:hypothetical protein